MLSARNKIHFIALGKSLFLFEYYFVQTIFFSSFQSLLKLAMFMQQYYLLFCCVHCDCESNLTQK